MKTLQERIVERAEKKYDKGKNSFLAIGALNSVALELLYSGTGNTDELRHEVRSKILRSLAAKGAQADIYAIRDNYGSGRTDSMDHVRVASRGGTPTGEWYHRPLGTEDIIVRASTDSLE